MYNLYTKFVKVLEICKQFSENLVNELGNVPRSSPVPKFSDLEVVALQRQRALIARNGYSTINCKSTRAIFVIHTLLIMIHTRICISPNGHRILLC